MLDRYSAPRTSVDFMSSYQITEKVRVLFEVRNLVGHYAHGGRRGEKEYFGDGILLAEYGYDLRTYSLGLKFDL